jgi:hypothetical protein
MQSSTSAPAAEVRASVWWAGGSGRGEAEDKCARGPDSARLRTCAGGCTHIGAVGRRGKGKWEVVEIFSHVFRGGGRLEVRALGEMLARDRACMGS